MKENNALGKFSKQGLSGNDRIFQSLLSGVILKNTAGTVFIFQYDLLLLKPLSVGRCVFCEQNFPQKTLIYADKDISPDNSGYQIFKSTRTLAH
ncbi:MAG: hypothetical protein KA821_04970 [Chitinophagaceae bacterium]|nr:hypothetical protein [Chitinophagaceae bacterium]